MLEILSREPPRLATPCISLLGNFPQPAILRNVRLRLRTKPRILENCPGQDYCCHYKRLGCPAKHRPQDMRRGVLADRRPFGVPASQRDLSRYFEIVLGVALL